MSAASNSDSKRPRLDSWGSASSPLSHEIHHSHSQHIPQHSSSYISSSSPATSFGCGGSGSGAGGGASGGGTWAIKTPPQPSQHALSHSRSHSLHVFQPQHQSSSLDASAPTTPSAASMPHVRNATDQQQLRSFSVSSNSSTLAGQHPPHYQQEPSNYYSQQIPTQQPNIAPAATDGRAALLENISPASSSTLAPGPSPIMTSGFSSAPTGMMNHQQQQMNGGSPVVATPTGGMMSNAVTTYPPRRKAIRAAQACDACRARKAKCDEGRPSCGFCKESQVPCVYREVPPPKQDRTLLQILERLGRVENLLVSMNSERAEGEGVDGVPPKEVTYPSAQSQDGLGNHVPHHQRTANITEVPLEEDEQLAIPVRHATAAHKLMWWPSIRKLIDDEFLANEGYVMQEEEKRGPLRLHGRGESVDSPESMFEDMDDGDAGYVWDSGIGIDESTNGPWRGNEGSGMEDGLSEGMDYMGARRRPNRCPGSGLTTGGGLRLDHQTIMGLLDSYLANIHILHPVVDKAAITKFAFMFSERVAAGATVSPTTPYPAAASGPAVGLGLGGADAGNDLQGIRRRNSAVAKRKRSITGVGSMHSMSPQGMVPAQRIPRTLHSALVLLIMALGAICLHRKPVPGALPPIPRSPDFRTATPPFKTPTSPFSGASSPYHSYFNQQQPNAPPSRHQGHELRNIDVIPGLAYFGRAMEIMGVLAAGNELENVQICLLAGLYWGQLGRVLDSWKWINYACMGCQILIRMRLASEKSPLRRDLILRAFWSCLQLESDILAELDLPPSGISRLEDSMPLPSSIDSTDTRTKEDDPQMWMYYLAQIALRKLLNRAHTTLYNPDKAKLDSPRSLAIARELDYQLEQWKLHLPEPLRWEESDPPSSDINAARLRAKYFGARYIIHRPFVYYAIHNTSSGGPFSTSSPTASEMSQPSSSATTPGGLASGSILRRISIVGGDDRADIVPVSLESSCRKCLESAIQSTTAFHAFSPDDNRPIITNVFGTAHAQFGNLLVLQAAYQSPSLRSMIPSHTLNNLLSKTIHWLQGLSPISSALRRDSKILENAASKLDFSLSQGGGY